LASTIEAGVHTVVGTTAKVSDMSQFGELLHGDEERVSADRGYDYPQIHAQLEPRLSIGRPYGPTHALAVALRRLRPRARRQ
jgi:hypothetical protein